jgi:hypothetical protein
LERHAGFITFGGPRSPSTVAPAPPVITYNLYCDESSHLQHDGHPFMVLGAIWCDAVKSAEIFQRLKEIKARHGLWPRFEVKWTKVSPALLPFYQDYLDYFFDDDDLHFRALIADKRPLRHLHFGQTHDDWYYKMYFNLLKVLLTPGDRYRIYLDVKDTRGGEKVDKLHEVLSNNLYDFDRKTVERLQQVRSHEVEALQLTDLLIGAINYANRGETGSAAKRTLVDRIRARSRYTLTRTTLVREDKLNLFVWKPQEVAE